MSKPKNHSRCNVKGCERRVCARGLCRRCYDRILRDKYKTGKAPDGTPVVPPSESLIARLKDALENDAPGTPWRIRAKLRRELEQREREKETA